MSMHLFSLSPKTGRALEIALMEASPGVEPG